MIPRNLPVPFPCACHIYQQQGPGPLGTTRLTSMSSRRTGRPALRYHTNRISNVKASKEHLTAPGRILAPSSSPRFAAGEAGGFVTTALKLVCLFTSFLAIPLARQSCLYALLLAGLQVVGVTLDFLDDVFLLYLPLEPAQSIFERFAFLNTNLCQKIPPPNLPWGLFYDTGNTGLRVKRKSIYCINST